MIEKCGCIGSGAAAFLIYLIKRYNIGEDLSLEPFASLMQEAFSYVGR